MTFKCLFGRLPAILGCLLLAGLAFGAEPGKTKKLRNDDRPRPDKPAVSVPSVPAEETRVFNFEPVYSEPLQGAIEPVFLENDMSWYPHELKPPFGQDHGSDKPWMIYAGAARISAQRSASPVAIPDALKIGAPLGSIETFYIVHFAGKIQSEWKDAVIKAGAVSSETYLTHNALVFRMTPKVFKAVEAIPEVDWIGYYEPAYKISPRIGRMPVDATTRSLAGTSLLVGLHGRVDPEAVRPKLEALGLNVITDIKRVKAEKHAPTPWTPWILSVEASRDKALEIAAIEEVQFVWEPATVKSFRAFSSGGIMQSGSNAPWALLGSDDPTVNATIFPLWFRGLQGQHQMVGIADTGVDYGAGELFDDPVNPLDPGTSCAGGGPACFLTGNLKVPKGSLRDGSTDVCDASGGHGTGVTGSCCQDSHPNSTTESREPNQPGRGEFGEGISHEAQVVFAPFGWPAFQPFNQRLQWLDLASFGASVMNTSIVWLTGTGPTYDAQSWVYDTVIDTAEANGDHMLITNAAGNDGVCGTWDTGSASDGWAKNAVDVGASDDLARFDEMYSFGGPTGSNKGPDWTNPPGAASNDLIFPDIVAPGAGDSNNAAFNRTLTASADGTCGNADNGIQGFGGTSGSAPVVAGAIALIHQYYEEGNQPPITDPSAALMKATLINSAEAMDSAQTCMGRGVPSGEQGWGRPNLSNVLAFDDTTFEMNAFDVLNARGFDTSGQFDEYSIVITDTGQRLRVTMVYTDIPGNFGGQGRPYIVNDLDLQVTVGATTYHGNNFNTSTGLSTAVTSASDGANTVENVFLSSAQLGAATTATVRVTMANAPTGRNQGYAIVVTGGITPTTGIAFDQVLYACDDEITVTAVDSTPTLSATITSSTDSETVALVSIGFDQYQNATPLPTSLSDTTNDNGTLGFADGDVITVTYEITSTDTATIICSPDTSFASVFVSGGCDSWDSAAPDANTGEKYVPYLDTNELLTIGFLFTNDEPDPLTNVTATLSESSGCLTLFGDNPAAIGTVPSGATAGATWSVSVGACAQRMPTTISLDVMADGFPVVRTLSATPILINADDVIAEQSVCFDHSSADMTSLPLTFFGFPDIGWTRSTSASCDEEDRTDATCSDGGTGMYKQGFCGANNIPDGSAGAIVPPAPIPLVNAGATSPTGEPWRYALRRFSFYGATSVPGDDEVLWAAFFDNAYLNPLQITDGSTPVNDWPLSVGFFSMESFEFGGMPTAWDWDTANGGTPGADPDCGVAGTPPDNQINICFTPSESGEIGAVGDVFLNFALLAAEEQLFVGGTAGGPTDGFGVDNPELIWEEIYAGNNTGDCSSSGQCGQVRFDRTVYRSNCGETAIVSVIDDNAGDGPLAVTVASTTGGDSETIQLFKQGADPIYAGVIDLVPNVTAAPGDGKLQVNVSDNLTVTYNDVDNGTTNPCVDVSTTTTDYPSANLSIVGRPVELDNGDGDGIPDTNETVTFELEVQNDGLTSLDNVVVTIETVSPEITCVLNGTSNFGTIAGGASANNPDMQRFAFQVDSSYECSDPDNPDSALITARVTADNVCGSNTPLSTFFLLDLNAPGPSARMFASYAADEDSDAHEVPPAGSRLLSRESPAGATNRSERGPAETSPLVPREGAPAVKPRPGDSGDSGGGVNRTTTCGNAQYDSGESDSATFFGGGQADNPDCILAELWDPMDFGITTTYNISSVCFGNDIDFTGIGGPWPNRWRIHPDNAGAPDLATVLATGVVSTGDGTGEVSFPVTVNLGAGELFWVVLQGDNTSGCCTGEDFNLEFDNNTPTQSYRNDCDGVGGLILTTLGEWVIHTTLTPANLTCDTTDNSGLPANCAPSVSDPPELQLKVDKNGSLVDLTFQDAGSSFDYNVYVSTEKESIVSDPFNVESPDGKRTCGATTVDNGPTLTIVGYNIEAGLSASNIHHILVGASSSIHNGTLGSNSLEGDRTATSYCATFP